MNGLICTTILLEAVLYVLGNPDGHLSGDSTITRIVSFNTALTNRVEYYTERRAAMPRYLHRLDADVLCLQEVWFSDDMQRILDQFGEQMYSFSALHGMDGRMIDIPDSATPCFSPAFLTYHLPCTLTNCRSSNTLDKLQCAIATCGFMRLPQQCITCLVLSKTDTAFSNCSSMWGRQFNTPGLLLLSKKPLNNVRITPFVSSNSRSLIPRSYISADVEDVGRVVCTHNTANLGQVYYGQSLRADHQAFRSWGERNLAEARTLVTATQNVQTAVVMGDLNSSPNISVRGITADFPATVEVLTDSGLETAYMDRLPLCTWCRHNQLANTDINCIYDHILTKNCSVLAACRLTDSDLDVPMSDHFGIEALMSCN